MKVSPAQSHKTVGMNYLKNFTENNLCAASGVVLLVDAPDGRFFKSIGVTSVEDLTPLKVRDAFKISSNTKYIILALGRMQS